MAGGILALVGKAKPGGGKMPMMPDGEDSPDSDAGEMAAEDFLSAIASKDAGALYYAFERMKKACEAQEGAGDTEESEEESDY